MTSRYSTGWNSSTPFLASELPTLHVMKRSKINIVTLGCSKNLVDSEKLMAKIVAGGYQVTHDSPPGSARVAIINTCGFIADAREESIDTILRFAEARKKGSIDRLYVTGCLAERYRDELRREIPEVDNYFGVNHLDAIIRELDLKLQDTARESRVITGPGHYAYLKVSEGCNRGCAFCAIPMIRGKHRSVEMELLLEEARYLSARGVRELILIAQDLTYYGMDICGERQIALLTERLASMKLFDWLRLHYLYPAGFPESLIPVFRDIPGVCRYIDIPLQHISDRVLKIMRRGHNSNDTRKLLYRIREEIPGAAIRTTLIVGHPGEGEKEFGELYEFVRDFRFERLGVFAYSHEENTPAGNKYSDEISEDVKAERIASIMELQQQISADINSAMTGEVIDVMIDRREGDWLVGRSEFDSPGVDQEILVPITPQIETGTLRKIRITGSGDFDLFGEPVS